MKAFKLKALVCAMAVPLLAGCATSYREAFMGDASKKGWTEEQKLAAYYYSLRLLFLKKGEDGKFSIVYSRLPKKDVISQLKGSLDDLDDMLDPRNAGMNQYIKLFDLRPYLERQERILKAVYARVLADDNNSEFQKALGEVDLSAGTTDEYGHSSAKGFNGGVLSLADPRKAFPFTSKVIEEARAAGLLKEIRTKKLSDSSTLARKDFDPDHPDDPVEFVWVPKKVEYELVQFRVQVEGEKPQNNNPNYVEIWRLNDGKREASPAAKAFLDGSGRALLVLDSHKQGEPGFGLPDVVKRVPESALYGEEIIAAIFPEKPRRIERKIPPNRADIVFAGTPVDPWEKCSGECPIPKADSYRSKPLEANYNVRFIFSHKKKPDPADPLKEVEYVAKEWYSPAAGASNTQWGPGKVVLYYKPKAQCDGKITDAKVDDGDNKKKVLVTCQDGSEKSGMVTPKSNLFIEDQPAMIDFSVGEKRWRVNLAEQKRRTIALEPKYAIGVYTSDVDGDKDDPHAH